MRSGGFETLQEKYGKGVKRRTEYDEIEQISAAEVVLREPAALREPRGGLHRAQLAQHEYLRTARSSTALCIMADGSMKVSQGRRQGVHGARDHPLHRGFRKDGDASFYTMIIPGRCERKAYAKRFQIGGVTRDKL